MPYSDKLLAVLIEQKKRPRLRKRDRIFWAWLSRFWSNWRSVLVIVQAETVVRWHHQGCRLYWRWKSRTGKVGRPKIDAEIRKLIRCMSSENPLWSTPIRLELRVLGHEASKVTVDKYRVRHHRRMVVHVNVTAHPAAECTAQETV